MSLASQDNVAEQLAKCRTEGRFANYFDNEARLRQRSWLNRRNGWRTGICHRNQTERKIAIETTPANLFRSNSGQGGR